MTFRYLDDATLREVTEAATALGFADPEQFKAVTQPISPAFVSTFAVGGTAQARLVTLLFKMNTTRMLVSTEIPLKNFLERAQLLAAGAEEGNVFLLALERMSPDGGASPAGPGAPAGPVLRPLPSPNDVNALPTVNGSVEIQILEDDTLDISFLHDGSVASRSVAKVLVHRHFDGQPSFGTAGVPDEGQGTGWLIAPTLMITNHHVINARGPFEEAASDADFELQGRNTRVQFDDYEGGKIVQVASKGMEASDPELDFALLRIPAAQDGRRPLRLRPNPITKPQEAALRERVNVLQHPEGKPMRLGFRDNFVVTGSGEKLSYLTDTAGGSSGSPIFDDAWFVAALHRGWRTLTDQPVEVWGKSIKQENYGTPIGQILDHLAAQHPSLHAEIVADIN